MIVRGKSEVATNRGLDRRNPALNINSPFVWVPGKENDSNKFPNFGNVGEDLEYFNRGDTSSENVWFADAPYAKGEPVGAYRTLRAWMPTVDANGSENIDVANMLAFPEITDGSVLIFARMVIANNGWEEIFLAAGGNPLDTGALGWSIGVNNGGLIIRWRTKFGVGGFENDILGNLTVGGERRVLIHLNNINKTIKVFENGLFLSSTDVSASLALWGSANNEKMLGNGLGLTLFDNDIKIPVTGYVPGSRPNVASATNMSAFNMRDIMVMGTHDNTLKVDTNLPAIAAAFQKIAPGHLPQELKGYVE